MELGDRLDNDILPAKAIGMRTVWVKQGPGGLAEPYHEAEAADMVIDSISSFMAMVQLAATLIRIPKFAPIV